jgi:hypothetical protein
MFSKLSTPTHRPANPSVSTEGSFAKENDRGVMLVIHISLVPMLRVNNTKHLFPLYTFMASTWTLPFISGLAREIITNPREVAAYS